MSIPGDYELIPASADERIQYVRQREEPRVLLGNIEYLHGSRIRAVYHDEGPTPTDLGDYYTENEAIAALKGAATVDGRLQ